MLLLFYFFHNKYLHRVAFIVLGIPGLLIAFLALFLTNPLRGINEVNKNDKSFRNSLGDSKKMLLTAEGKESSDGGGGVNNHHKKPSIGAQYVSDLKLILSIRPYLFANIGLSAINFTLGGLSAWYM